MKSVFMPTHDSVDVIVPVHGALQDVERCLEALDPDLRDGRIRLMVVNDGSDLETTTFLRGWCRDRGDCVLIEHPTNQGYTRAVNSGLSRSTAGFVVLLNSDTVVSEGWIDGLIRCARSAPEIGLVGPLSNAASWQSIPRVRDERGAFAANEMSHDEVEEWSSRVRRASVRAYPRVPVLNGFCTLLRRDVIEAVGLLDEVSFPLGYGEENDYCLRARAAGFQLAVADDVFVYHAKSRSFGHERREKLSRAGSDALRRKHGDHVVAELSEAMTQVTELNELRERLLRAAWAEKLSTRSVDPLALRILFLLPVKGGSGGANSVIQEAAELYRLGVHVRVSVRAADVDRLRRLYGDVAGIRELLVPTEPTSVLDVARGFDVVVATLFKSVDDLAAIADAYPEILPAYYVQDYEPYFFEPGTASWRHARRSYELVPQALLFAKTRWIAEEVARLHGVPVHEVEPSIDHDVFRPAPRIADGVLRVTAMIRPQTPRRGAARTMRVLKALESRHPGLSVHVFGCDADDPRLLELETDFPFVSYGTLSRPEVASLLRQSDVFVDLSDYQAFGRTGLEAMASGCVSVVPRRGGTDEYAVDGENAIVVDTSDETECIERISILLASPTELERLRRHGMTTAARYSVHAAAMSELLVLADGVAAHRAGHTVPERRTSYSLPARHPHGEATTRGAQRLVSPWRSVSLRRAWNHAVVRNDELEGLDSGLLLLQVGSDVGDPSAFCEWLRNWRAKGGVVVVDLVEDVFEPDHARSAAVEESKDSKWVARLADAVLVDDARRTAGP